MVLCNPDAPIDYRICRKEQAECPINDFKLVQSKSDNSSSWTYRKVENSPLWLAFTTKGKGLPLTKFVLSESLPCMDPNDSPTNVTKFNGYKLEIPMSKGCKVDSVTNEETDDRYKQMDLFQISEFDLLYDNGIIQKLKSLPEYD